jgi:hypothetical protein
MRALLASLLLAACVDPTPAGIPTPPPPPGPPDVPDTGFHLAMTSLDGFSYTVSLEAGVQYFSTLVDTGSSTTGLAAATCTSCTGIDPLYTPGDNAKEKTLPADSTCPANLPVCTQYADGTGWAGNVYTDQTWLRGPFVSFDFVAMSVQEGFFTPMDNSYQGILGLGPKELLETGTGSYMDGLAAQYMSLETMAFRLCPFTGDLWIDGYDPTAASADVQYTPMLPIDVNNNPFYQVEIADFAFGGTSMGLSKAAFGPVLPDTGTSISYIPDPVLNPLIAKINNDPGFKALFPAQTLADTNTGDCAMTAGVTSEMVDAMLPVFTVTFPAASGGTFAVDIPASSSYLYPGGGGQFCLAFSSAGPDASGGSLIGDTLLTGMLTVFDVQNLQIGFAPAAGCDPFDPPAPSPRAHKQSPYFRPAPLALAKNHRLK